MNNIIQISMSKESVTLTDYLKGHIIEKGDEYTHTRIGDKNSKISGGSYNIRNEKEFLDNYYRAVFEEGKNEYLTERQYIEKAPVAIDIDMRYNNTVTKKQHTEDHIKDLIYLYAREIQKICNINNIKFDVFVMEKPNVNVLEDKTKDGIHIIFGVSMHRAGHVLIRENVIPELEKFWQDLPLTNSSDDLIDEAVTRGIANWQLYGSKKPNHQSYLIKYHYTLEWKENEKNWDLIENNITQFKVKKNLEKLSIRNKLFQCLEFKEEYKEIIDEYSTNLNKKKKKFNKFVVKECKALDVKEINNIEKLDEYVNEMIDKLDESPIEYILKETHNFVMILSDKYYGPGSYSKWISVGWALKNTSPKLLPTWLKFSSQSKEFNYEDIPKLVDMWYKFHYNNPDGLTSRSIMYWAKSDNLKEYEKVRNETISHFVDETIKAVTEWDFANLVYHMFKDKFVCVSIKNSIWYEYTNHKWFEIDSGNSLRLILSTKLHELYLRKVTESMDQLQKMDQSDENYEPLRKRSNKLADLSSLLKKTNWKNSIMKEAKELFYDSEFLNKLDNNPNLMCFNNYIIDFKERSWRSGRPDDYISKCTNIDYIPYEEVKKMKQYNDVIDFINQLFPIEELRNYMWEHLASIMIGNNHNQTFNVYLGGGRNGKSKLVELMSKVLGNYKATVPITLVTGKRNSIGSTSSEIVQLMGIRYAVMQEPSKGEKINDGILKELTGGDPIQGRALFKESITFIPQFKLAVCSNVLPDICTNDDGTWRRIRVCDFVSKFLEKPFEDEKFSKEDYPYQYELDAKIDEKFTSWAPILASILIDKAFVNQGVVKDSKIVLGSSEQYREGQDYLAEFCKEKIKKVDGGKIKKTELVEVFKIWYQLNYGNKVPKARELYEHMDKKFGKFKTCWSNVSINYDDEDDD